MRQHAFIHYIDAGVDKIAVLRGDGLFDKAVNRAALVRSHDSVKSRIFDRSASHSDLRAAAKVKVEHFTEVHVAECVAARHHEDIVEVRFGVFDRARRAERLGFKRESCVYSLIVGNEIFDYIGQIPERKRNIGIAVERQPRHNIVEHRNVGDFQHRFRGRVGERAKPRAEAARKYYCVHKFLRFCLVYRRTEIII